MKATIYNPYLDTLGGGERYTMAVASALTENGWEVDIEWKDQEIKKSLEERFGINLAQINFIPDIKRGENYDLCFWVSDGSIPTLRSRKNILHFQVPFHGVNGKSLLNKMKLFRIGKIICNSNFTKKVIDQEYGVDSLVIYPPVDTKKIKSKRKENIILTIGRFSQLKQAKRQDILIEAFKKLYDAGYTDWSFVLAGGVEVGADEYVKELGKKVGKYPITIIKSPPYTDLINLYGRAKIFWSAAGYGINEQKEPEKTEHFGISAVEAMAAGAIPLLFEAGGHKEIINDGKNGFLWNKVSELIAKSKKVINNHSIWASISESAKLSSQQYGYEKFKKEMSQIF
jgi:glycosyltransferase involved in cell wall biosynthesis